MIATPRSPRAIVTYYHGQDFERQYVLSSPRMRRYAERCGADFITIRGEGSYQHGEHGKFEVYETFKTYDQCLFLDVDVIIQGDPPNIFEQVPLDKVSGVDEMPLLGQFKFFDNYNQPAAVRASQGMPAAPAEFIMNSGVFVISKQLAELYRPPEHPLPEIAGAEQSLFSCRMQDAGAFHPLETRWNCTYNSPRYDEEQAAAYFVHLNMKPLRMRMKLMRQLTGARKPAVK